MPGPATSVVVAPAFAFVCLDESEFPGDSDRHLKWLQSDTYSELIAGLYARARSRLLAAATLADVETPLSLTIRSLPTLERPIAVKAYRRIAAWFRFACTAGPQLTLRIEPESGDSGRAAWTGFFGREAAELSACNPAARAILNAAGAMDPLTAQAAESRLVDLLDARYGRLTLERRFGLLGRPADEAELAAWSFAEQPDWVALLTPPQVCD
jgi:hypothetical protein